MQILIPAAGMGKRLGSFTENQTKCMIKVHEKRLIEHTLDAALGHDIKRIIMVVGYQKENLRNFLGNSYKGLDIIYVDNDDYLTTNNIYSIYLARDYLIEDDTILIESDLIFEPEILSMLLRNKQKDLVLVDKFKSWMDGTVVQISDDFTISKFIPKKNFLFSEAHSYFKTLNIYKFSKEFLENIYIPFLDAYSSALGNNEYYEQVLRVIVHLETNHLIALPLNGQKWYEIDDVQDLDIANIIFAKGEEKYELLSSRYGGYWRFDDLIDFCYLVNPYFPTQTMEDELKYNFKQLIHNYPSTSKIQSLLAGKIFNIPSEYIIVGNGAAELINVMTDFFDMELGLFAPTFEEYTAKFKNVITKVSNKEGFSYSKQDLIELAESKAGIILVNPDNPTGNYIPHSDIYEILEIFRKDNKFLILDESFIDFACNGFDESFLNTADLEKFSNLVIVKSIGKSHGIGGLRLGVIATSNTKIIQALAAELPIWNISSLSENYLQIFSKYQNEYMLSCKKIVEERKYLHEELCDIPFLHPFKSEANYVFCKVLDRSSKKLACDLCDQYSILIKDCSGKANVNSDFVRIAVRDRQDNQYLIDSLKALI